MIEISAGILTLVSVGIFAAHALDAFLTGTGDRELEYDPATDYGCIIRLLVLTGQRRGEVGGMCWSELNFTRQLWSLPGERAKNGIAHDVPLSLQALAIVTAICDAWFASIPDPQRRCFQQALTRTGLPTAPT